MLTTETQQVSLSADEAILACPRCGNTYTHMRGVAHVGDVEEVTSVEISCECEEGCRFTINLQQHKGNTELTAT